MPSADSSRGTADYTKIRRLSNATSDSHRSTSVVVCEREYMQPRLKPMQFVLATHDPMCLHAGWLSPRLEGRFLPSFWGNQYAQVLSTPNPLLLKLLLFETDQSLRPCVTLHVHLDDANVTIASGLSRKLHRFRLHARLPGESRAITHRFEFAVNSRQELHAWCTVLQKAPRQRRTNSDTDIDLCGHQQGLDARKHSYETETSTLSTRSLQSWLQA